MGVVARAGVFEGFERVPWSSFKHAYGSAHDVPTMLSGLASADPEEREDALGFFWGTVHHQGDIYDSTIAAVPFLVRAAIAPGFPDRAGILDLLASIAGYSLGRGGASEPDPQEAKWLPAVRRAYDGVMAGTSGYLAALRDADVQVRYSAAGVLMYCRDERALVMGALRAALAGESDPDVQVALINAYLVVASADPYDAASIDQAAQQWLLDLLASEAQDPHIRLAALAQIAERIPQRLLRGCRRRGASLVRGHVRGRLGAGFVCRQSPGEGERRARRAGRRPHGADIARAGCGSGGAGRGRAADGAVADAGLPRGLCAAGGEGRRPSLRPVRRTGRADDGRPRARGSA
jgi:hypothetical protein